jgi:hypothetical protein
MPYSKVEITEYSHRIGKSVPTLWRWVRQGCDLRDPKSVREWQVRNEIRKTNIQRAQERKRDKEHGESPRDAQDKPQTHSEPAGKVTLAPAGRKGAAAALERLETAEERAHARLEAALVRGDQMQIQACQDFWLKCSETLRRLDLAVELARRDTEEQVSKKLACDVTLASRTGFGLRSCSFYRAKAGR